MTIQTRISVPLAIEERDALLASARRALRNPQAQARHLLCLSLQKAGLLAGDPILDLSQQTIEAALDTQEPAHE